MHNSIPLALPQLGEEEIAAVTRVLNSGRLSLGQERDAFERELADRVGARHAVAVSSGTAALHLAVRACGIGPGDEVITSPLSFVASTNCLLYEGARPVFVDIDPDSLTLDVAAVEAAITGNTRAILGVDIFGYPADWQALAELGRRHDLVLIEDSAQALGAKYRGENVGSLGHPAIFSFYPNKQLTTAEGGVVVTDDGQQYELLQSLANQGRGADLQVLQPQRLGFNYRMSELSAALGRVQLTRLSEFLTRRAELAGWYGQRLQGVDGLTLPRPDDDEHRRSWFCYLVRLDPRFDRERVIAGLAAAGIASKAYLPAIHLMPHLEPYGYAAGDFPLTEAVAASTLALPFYVGLEEEAVERVCNTLIGVLQEGGR